MADILGEGDVRTLKLHDLPALKRLLDTGVTLDSELAFTRADDRPDLLTSYFLPSRGLHTLVARSDKQTVFSQFRLRAEDTHARITFMAPGLEHDADDTVWLLLLDAMAAEAGRRGAHMLTAEVDEYQELFSTLRVSGFAIYARQEIWQRLPGVRAFPGMDAVELTVETDADAHGVQLLYSNIVPRLVQPIALPPCHSEGLVYRKNERVEGYIAISEGRSGIYLTPYLHPDVFSEAAAIIAAAAAHASRPAHLPIYVCVRRYQDWLEDALVDLGFEPWTRQAVMVRHIAAGVRTAAFAPLSRRLEAVPKPAQPPGITESMFE
jgi:hypothetical protein